MTQTVAGEVQERSGVLGVDRTRGKYHQFSIDGHQIAFPQTMFQRRQDGQLHLNAEGRELWRQCFILSCRGVTVTGAAYSQGVQINRGGPYENRLCIHIQDIKANPDFDPAPRTLPPPPKPKELIEEEERLYREAIKNETPAQRSRRLYNEQLAKHARDLTVEQHMINEGI
jgi:hypothetical protein